MILMWLRKKLIYLYSSIVMVSATVSCQTQSTREKETVAEKTADTLTSPPLFTLLSADKTQIDFNNVLTEGLNTNVLAYEYFYNGGGVAVGDVNNDGWDDIYFTGNMIPNKLYLNKGSESPMKFQDITQQASVAGRNGPWATGVTMADVNGDGWLDIYVCYSGNVRPENRTNELYINQGVDSLGIPHFEEQAETYGLASISTSTQAAFFDYDHDGDLDMFLLNHHPFPLPILDEVTTAEYLKKEDPVSGPRLFRNDISGAKGKFIDVTAQAGISSSSLSYGLGVGISDVNGDGWPDIHVGNDYAIPDYLYINQKNGTFSDELSNMFGHTSHFSMGNDIADINNDALPDLLTLDMLPEDNRRQKLLFAPDNYELFNLNLRVGFHYQFMRNMLHINNGTGPDGKLTFSEIGQLAGISNTDWSWAALFADYDNDGWKDLFITNGHVRDFTNMDFMKYMGDFTRSNEGKLIRQDILELVHQIPSTNVSNYIYQNNGGLTFADKKAQWGFGTSAKSTGAAYADLDNDGDLDLIVNNINKPAFIYQNEADNRENNHYLNVALKGAGKNTAGLGAKVILYANGKKQLLEQMPTRGYQSSVSPVLHFGLGEIEQVDTLQLIWPTGKQQWLTDVKADQVLTLDESEATSTYSPPKNDKPVYKEVSSPLAFQHQENGINDFKRQPLIVNPLSFDGPCITKGDVNGDGLEDIFLGGATGQAAQLFLQQKGGKFIKGNTTAFDADKSSEDVNAVFFDANGDNAPDLYVCSGGYGNFMPEDKALQDRLYMNDGKGNFTKNMEALPAMLTSSSCVRVADINEDAHQDLFVGSKVIPGQYPVAPESYVLLNDGKGNFKNSTQTIAPDLQKAGMISDAAWVDLNGDQKKELIVVGEWMPIQVFAYEKGKLTDKTADYFDKIYSGWWNTLLVDDLNSDGHPDLLVGNMGLNTQCKASDTEPAELFYKDFDNNGSIDPIFCFYIQGKSYPSVTRDELLDQMSMMRTRFPDYKSYADTQLEDIFSEKELEGVEHLEVTELKTLYFEGGENGKFTLKTLPLEVQESPVFTITPLDFDADGYKDLLLCGNINQARLRFGNADANFGVLLKGDGQGNFSYVPQNKSGFDIRGDVRSVVAVNGMLLFGINQAPIKAYKTGY